MSPLTVKSPCTAPATTNEPKEPVEVDEPLIIPDASNDIPPLLPSWSKPFLTAGSVTPIPVLPPSAI